jgi:SNF2 family DNA or RNA helicase
MIHPRAIREFIARKRDSHEWLKDVPSRDLDELLHEQRFKIVRHKALDPLGHHQKVCILLGIAYPSFAFWLDMGTGKTRIALELMNYWFDERKLDVALVLAPSESAVITWENQIKEWRIKLPFITLLNSPSEDKINALRDLDEGLIVATYQGITRALCKSEAVKRGKRKTRLVPDLKLIKSLAGKLSAIIPDEATKLGNHDSLQFRVVTQLRKHVSIFYELAGRSFGRDPTMLWSQLKLIDKGETLGETLGLFRAAFFKEKDNRWGGSEYEFKRSMKKELNRILRHRSITYHWDECIDLPPLVHMIEEVTLPNEANKYYEQFAKQIKRAKTSYIERKSLFTRMRQISSGFVGFLDDESGERAEIAFAVNPKLDRLLELIEEVPDDCKWVVFHEFTWSGRTISTELKKLKIKHEWLWGGSKDPRGQQDRFDNDPRTRGWLINHKKGGYALNLQSANYVFYFESPVGVIDRDQSDKRCRRQGQTRDRVFMSDLVCQGTWDSRILSFHREGRDLYKALMRNAKDLG